MQWIRHHNPNLIILDDSGRETERVSLDGYSKARLGALLDKRGFKNF